MQRGRVQVVGASGTGTTTLARAVADAWSVPHADVDDYFWVPTDPPYSVKRAPADRVALMAQVFLPREAWVLSGCMLGWGDAVSARCDAVVFLTLDPVERLRRLASREHERRTSSGVDERALEEFFSWARGYDDPTFDGRSRVRHEEWLATLSCPVLRLDSTLPTESLRDLVLAREPGQAART